MESVLELEPESRSLGILGPKLLPSSCGQTTKWQQKQELRIASEYNVCRYTRYSYSFSFSFSFSSFFYVANSQNVHFLHLSHTPTHFTHTLAHFGPIFRTQQVEQFVVLSDLFYTRLLEVHMHMHMHICMYVCTYRFLLDPLRFSFNRFLIGNFSAARRYRYQMGDSSHSEPHGHSSAAWGMLFSQLHSDSLRRGVSGSSGGLRAQFLWPFALSLPRFSIKLHGPITYVLRTLTHTRNWHSLSHTHWHWPEPDSIRFRLDSIRRIMPQRGYMIHPIRNIIAPRFRFSPSVPLLGLAALCFFQQLLSKFSLHAFSATSATDVPPNESLN